MHVTHTLHTRYTHATHTSHTRHTHVTHTSHTRHTHIRYIYTRHTHVRAHRHQRHDLVLQHAASIGFDSVNSLGLASVTLTTVSIGHSGLGQRTYRCGSICALSLSSIYIRSGALGLVGTAHLFRCHGLALESERQRVLRPARYAVGIAHLCAVYQCM